MANKFSETAWAKKKTKKIQKMVEEIRRGLADRHDPKCTCPICESTYFVIRTMAYLREHIESGNRSEKVL